MVLTVGLGTPWVEDGVYYVFLITMGYMLMMSENLMKMMKKKAGLGKDMMSQVSNMLLVAVVVAVVVAVGLSVGGDADSADDW